MLRNLCTGSKQASNNNNSIVLPAINASFAVLTKLTTFREVELI